LVKIACAAASYIASNPWAFLQRSHFQTQRLLDQHWRAIEVLAAALLLRKRLTGAESSALFLGAHPTAKLFVRK
jgi:hypothetical protein